MQLDIFSPPEVQPKKLRQTVLPELAEAAARVGTATHWRTLTLSQVLELWDGLYSDFVAVLDAPIHHAKKVSKDAGEDSGPLARKFYQREYERLMQGQRQLHATVEGLFCDNLLDAINQGQDVLRASGLSEAETEDSHEFFNEVIQHPDYADLGKLLPVLMQDLAHEYLRLAH